MTNKEKFGNLLNDIDWDNWRIEEDYIGKSKGRFFDITEVLYCKLEWIKEECNLENNEHLDTIKQIQQLLEVLDEDKIIKMLQK